MLKEALHFKDSETAIRWFLGQFIQLGRPIRLAKAWRNDREEMAALEKLLSDAVEPVRVLVRIGKSGRSLVIGAEITTEE